MFDRRAMLIALLGASAAGAASAQQLPFIGGDGGGLLGGVGAVGGAGADAAGGLVGGLGGGLAGGLGGGFAGGGQDAFRSAALQDGSYAIQTSQIALSRSRNRDVRQFAQLEINEQVSVAAALGVQATPMPLRPDQAAVVEQLQNASGRAFDALYVDGQIAGHQELLSLNSSYSHDGPDLAERRVAVVAVPSIQTHLAILRRLQRRGMA